MGLLDGKSVLVTGVRTPASGALAVARPPAWFPATTGEIAHVDGGMPATGQ